MSFKDIRVIGVDEIRTYRPEPEKWLYNVYFELSMVPPSGWVQIFEQKHHFPEHAMVRRAWIDGRHVVVQCAVNEIKDALRDIKRAVSETNQKYREFLRKQSVNRETETQKEKSEHEKINEILGSLDFE
jgi:hypothetical protein